MDGTGFFVVFVLLFFEAVPERFFRVVVFFFFVAVGWFFVVVCPVVPVAPAATRLECRCRCLVDFLAAASEIDPSARTATSVRRSTLSVLRLMGARRYHTQLCPA